MTTYIYPKDMKAKANLWLWSLRDFVILGVALLLSAVLLVQFGLLPPAAMTIRLEAVTVLDFLRWAGQYFLFSQQYYEWG